MSSGQIAHRTWFWPVAVVAILCPVVSGCVLPAIKTVDPGWRFFVVDESHAPVVGASVTVARYAYPHGTLANQSTIVTDAFGLAQFKPRSKMGTWMLIPGHGPTASSWSWCVEAPGYAHRISSEIWRPSREETPVKVVLLAGATPPDPCKVEHVRRALYLQSWTAPQAGREPQM